MVCNTDGTTGKCEWPACSVSANAVTTKCKCGGTDAAKTSCTSAVGMKCTVTAGKGVCNCPEDSSINKELCKCGSNADAAKNDSCLKDETCKVVESKGVCTLTKCVESTAEVMKYNEIYCYCYEDIPANKCVRHQVCRVVKSKNDAGTEITSGVCSDDAWFISMALLLNFLF